MKKIIDYKIIIDAQPAWVTHGVKEHMRDGWQPLGGVSANYSGGFMQFAQAIVKYEEDKK